MKPEKHHVIINGYKIRPYTKYVHISQVHKPENRLVIPHDVLKEIAIGSVMGYIMARLKVKRG